ncbi:MAG: ammonium transporter [Anaerolineae bacterium]|nr:ammonium transporter [Anaerolineae bacterium]
MDLTNFLPAALALLLPFGLILLIASAVPEEQSPALAVNGMVAWGAAALAYFGLGFAFHFGGIAQVTPNPELSSLYWEWYPLDQSVDLEVARLWGVVALQGFGLAGEAATPNALLLFLSHLAMVGTTALLPLSVLPQRVRGLAAVLTGLLTGAVIYPLPGNWLWGGGWLAHLGASLGFGHGLVDFGGASVVFLSGSVVALAALFLFRSRGIPTEADLPAEELIVTTGPDYRLTVYEEPETLPEAELLPPTPMPSAYLPILSLLGAGLMLLGWLGLSAGLHVPTALNFSPAQAAVAGVLAALSAALTSAGYSWLTTRRFDPLMTSRGLAAGLVVALAGAPFMPIWVSLAAGLLMGLLLPSLIYFFERSLGDETGTLTTYGLSALLGLLLLPFLADGRAGQGWNGFGLSDYYGVAGQGVSGLWVASGFASDWPGQLQAQLVGVVAVAMWALLMGLLLFQTVKAILNAWARTGLELADPAIVPPARLEEAKLQTEASGSGSE